MPPHRDAPTLRPVILVVLGLAASACGSPDADRGLTEAATWSLSSQPRLSITADASGIPLFDVSGVVSWDDDIVIGHNGGHEVLLADRSGRLVETWGREGEGPGEFRYVSDLVVHRDTLFVFDAALGRIGVFARESGFIRADRIEDPGYFQLQGGRGDMLIAQTRSPGGFPPTGVIVRDTVRLVTVAEGIIRDTLFQFLGTEWTANQEAMYMSAVPFGAVGLSAVGRETMAAAGSDATEYLILDRASRRSTIPAPFGTRPVTDDDRTVFREDFLTTDPRFVDAARQFLESAPQRNRTPTLDSLMIDAHGHFWIRRFEVNPDQPREWAVVAPDGTVTATVTTPRGLRLTYIGERYVLGIHVDADGVESVVEYPLSRG